MLNRVETGFQVFGKHAERLKRELDYYMQDNCQSWELQAAGSYIQNKPAEGEEIFSAQQAVLDEFAK